MAYTVHLERRAERELRRLPRDVLKRTDAVFLQLAVDPIPAGAVKLSGRTNDGWRISVGDYRILYRIEGERIVIYRIRHRRDAYRQ